ncbi:glycine zipper 2TM domain-containing protein [Variovorax sp.]|jgi:outer membrane lipoprotein SlyB|uniref:glycine zipper 2TM domain-containing protein n=1 Tax=Variovorax sp. TaxID=1871043 RepID=UPI0037D99B49
MEQTTTTGMPSRQGGTQKLWVVIGVLAVAVAALGGALWQKHQGGTAASPPVALATGPAPDDFKPDAAPPALQPLPSGPTASATMAAPAPAMNAVPQPVPATGAAPLAAAPEPAAAPPCAVCGHVETVRAVQRTQRPSGVGMVAGGVVGGLVGNQIGHGGGRTAATVLGAVGGGYAGNEIEKRTHTVTVYQVGVRMDNGTLRSVETRSAPPIGKAVRLKGHTLSPADGHK